MITQERLNEAAIAIANKSVVLSDKALSLRIQGDHDARRIEHKSYILRVIYKCLANYDVSSELVSEDEIDKMLDTASKIIASI